MKGKYFLLVIILLLPVLNFRISYGQNGSVVGDIFASDSVLNLRLLTNMDSLLSDVGEDPSYHDAVLVYTNPRDSTRVEMNIGVKARGNFRKRPENCDFPPLKLKFHKEARQGSIFQEIKELKLVTHCQNNLQEFEQYVFQEYLIYRAYNLFTDLSFRVRLARITYVDLNMKMDSITRYGFILEDPKDMAERNHGELMDLETAPSSELDQLQYALMSLFNYMIMNTDFSVPIVHNVELVDLNPFAPPMPVPYDFDWSGLINIPYDSPFATSTTRYAERLYEGPCLKRKEFQQVFTEMIEKRDSLYQLYENFPYLNDECRYRSIRELKMFYTIIGNRELIKNEFIKKCTD